MQNAMVRARRQISNSVNIRLVMRTNTVLESPISSSRTENAQSDHQEKAAKKPLHLLFPRLTVDFGIPEMPQ